jgi:DMSO/TMAO reductase YedYZ molybdopterin-dependent catalytic subunit
VLHAGPVQRVEPGAWNLRLFGAVPVEKNLTFAEFTGMPQIQIFSDIHCVTRWSRLGNLWEGVATRKLVELANPVAGARFVIVHASGGFTSNISLDEFMDEDVLLARSNDGQLLSAEHGAPVRLVVPRLYFWKSAKWVTGLEFSTVDKPGFWERAGYHNHGDPWTEERFG